VLFDGDTKPFKPLEQLMAVFPAQSRKFLPIEWQSLMITKESPIIDFYPSDFSVDSNGKRQAWLGVALLPFVDEKRLHRTLESVYSTLTKEERKRNKRGYDRLYIHSENSCYDYFKELYTQSENEITRKNPLEIPSLLSGGITGRIWPEDNNKITLVGEQIETPLANCEDILNNQVICVKYRGLSYDDNYIFKAKLLDNVLTPQATLKSRDFDQVTPCRPHYQRDFGPARRFMHLNNKNSFNKHRY
jgi:5'-3' exoribonuclease 2